jgi:hypothetical protein
VQANEGVLSNRVCISARRTNEVLSHSDGVSLIPSTGES